MTTKIGEGGRFSKQEKEIAKLSAEVDANLQRIEELRKEQFDITAEDRKDRVKFY